MERSCWCLSSLLVWLMLAIVLSLAVTPGVGAAEEMETLSPNQRFSAPKGTPPDRAQVNPYVMGFAKGSLSQNIDSGKEVLSAGRVRHFSVENKRIKHENARLAKKVSDCEVEIEIILGNCGGMKNAGKQ